MARILLVEDNPVMVDAIRDVLEMAGHRVFVTGDGLDALEALPKIGPDLILSDVMMPRMDGFEFYQAVRTNPTWVFTPFIFLTAKGQEEDILRGKRLGADDYLVKPYSPENLLATVESKLTRARAVSQAAAKEMQTVKRAITQVLGHELRTPLTWIQGYTELLLGEAGNITPEELTLSLQSIKSGSDRLARLVEDAVMITMLDTGQAKEEFTLLVQEEDELNLYIMQVIDRMRFQANQRRVRLEAQLPPKLPPVRLAARFFTEALVRLVDNGIKFVRPDADSFVIVSAADTADGIEIVVSDNGIGVSSDQLERIFEPLVQIDRPKQEQQGVGLGLTVARGLIRLHGGRIWAESQPGKGTQMHVVLPHAK